MRRESEMSVSHNGNSIVFCGASQTAFNITKCLLVRGLLVTGNLVSVWRLVTDTQDLYQWGWGLACVVLVSIEGVLTAWRRAGVERKWWCPCFFLYLVTTLPAIWLLQLNQYDVITGKLTEQSPVSTPTVTIVTNTQPASISDQPATSSPTSTASDVPTDVWLIIVQESLVYLIVFSRWLLPRNLHTSRVFLAEILLEFLAIASDIMELLAIFDEDSVKSNLTVTYWILIVWSLSFIQFIPTLVHKRRFRRIQSTKMRAVDKACGEYFVDVVSTCMSIALQDLPFAVLRLYVMIELNLVTYSLIFFLLKNLVSLMLLFYRLVIVCWRLPCRKRPSLDAKAESGDAEGNMTRDRKLSDVEIHTIFRATTRI